MSITIAGREIGPGQPTYVIAELGINHNGNLDNALAMCRRAKLAGADAVKLQKRTVDVVYSPEQLAQPRPSVFGATNGDLKRGLEFGQREYAEIDRACLALSLPWFASCWDEASVDFIEQFDPPAYKIASACLTDHGLLRHTASKGKPLLISMGMSDLAIINKAGRILADTEIPRAWLHCTSTYPQRDDECGLRVLQPEFGDTECFSDHTPDLLASIVAVSRGACLIERHVTLDPLMWGSDQGASITFDQLAELVQTIRRVEVMLGDGVKRVYEREIPVRDKLRRVDDTKLQPEAATV